MIFAETARFILRDITPEDADAFFEMDSDPEVHRYLGTQPFTSKEQVTEIITSVRQQYADNGIGRRAIADPTTNRFMGWCGLKLVKDTINNRSHYYDLGYRLMRTCWGQGIATEASMASLAYGFGRLALPEIIATVNCGNAASNHVITKLGFIRRETFLLHGLQHYWYTIDQADWMNRNYAR